ncbi:cell wall hydrolase [Priestia koreensis]|uniref:Cell wall hydrolase SleB domain-containing protein n=1 Tax=Priestia koreensis TaxID=284581 RepID=A0A0M0KNV5_9BACI|nr:cell wall hydrolase [Priestia koreensis]KOO40307.1 hypothetical protein AMD01_21380 [Priestia koreensis]
MRKVIIIFLFIVASFSISFKTDITALAAGEGACKSDKTGFAEFDGLSNLDLMARLIYSEAQGEPMDGKKAIAKLVINRANQHSSEFGGDTVREVILNPVGGFLGMKTSYARCPDTSNAAWKNSLSAATDPTSVYIGTCLWFNTNDVFKQQLSSDGTKYKFPGTSTYKKVTEKYVIGQHTFFNVAK